MKKISTIIFLIFSVSFASAQDGKKVDLYLMVGVAPMYATSNNNISYFDGPLSATIQIYYNINRHFAAGIHAQAATFEGDLAATFLFGNFGLTGKYIINPNSRFKFYGGLILGQTLGKGSFDIASGEPNMPLNAEALEDIINYEERKFTVGLFAGLEIKIINSISFNLQVSQLDIFGAFVKDYIIYTPTTSNSSGLQRSNGYLYIAPGDMEAYTYVPFYTSGGFIFKFGKQKL